MKHLWIGVCLLAVLLLLCIGSTLAMEWIHAPIAHQLEDASKAALAGHWQEARILAAGAKNRWEQYRTFVACITDHEVLESADAQFARLKVLEQTRESTAFAAGCGELSAVFDALADMQDLSLQNLM